MAFTRTPATGIPATYEGTNDPDQLILLDEPSDITISGLDANDNIVVGTGALAVAALSNFKIYGNDGNDAITQTGGQLASSTVQGGNGNDAIIFASGNSLNSVIRGGADTDTITVAALNQSTVNGNKGNDTISVGGNVFSSRVYGGSENDIITLTGGVVARNSRFNGSKGADTITVATGANITGSSVFGGEGNDTLNVTGNGSTLYVSGDKGNDVINALGLTASNAGEIFGGEGNDIASVSVTGATDSVTTNMGVGADTLTLAGLGTHTVVFNRGDSVAATATTIPAPAVAFTNTVTFGNGVDTITGFTAGAGGDVLDIDISTSAAGFAVLSGIAVAGPLSSAAVYTFSGTLTGNVFVTAAGGTDTLVVVGGQNLTGAQLLANTTSAQVLVGTAGGSLTAANFA